MSAPYKNILLIGAGGNVGSEVFKSVTANPAFNVTVLTRTGSKSTFPSGTKVVSIDPSYPEDELTAIFKQQDAVVDLAPIMALGEQLRRMDIAAKAGVKRYIPSEYGSNTADPRVIEAMTPAFDIKIAVQEHMKAKAKEGLTWTAVINGAFFDWGLKQGFLGFNLQTHKAIVYDDATAKMHLSNLWTIGRSVAAILAHPDETANTFVHINSYHVSQGEILAALEKVTATKWEVESRSAAGEQARGQDLLKKGEIWAGFQPALCGMEFGGEDWKDWAKHTGLWNERLGLPPTNVGLEEEVRKIVEEEKANPTTPMFA